MAEQHEDAWIRTITVHDYRADEIRSVLHESNLRGLVEEAVLAVYEPYASGPEAADMLAAAGNRYRRGCRAPGIIVVQSSRFSGLTPV